MVEPKRFDTRFFVAAMPAGQRTREFGEEADQVEWVAPAVAVRRFRDGAMRMMPPTLITFAELAEFGSVAAALAGAAERVVRPVEPRVVVDGEDADLVLPGDPEYSDQIVTNATGSRRTDRAFSPANRLLPGAFGDDDTA
jgi:hypothetical protein